MISESVQSAPSADAPCHPVRMDGHHTIGRAIRMEQIVMRQPLSNRQRRELRKQIAAQAAKSSGAALEPVLTPKATKVREAPKTALQRLVERKALTAKQYRGLRDYGVLVRAAALADAHSMPSCLGALDRVDGSGSAGGFDQSFETAKWIADSRAALEIARMKLGCDPLDMELDAARAMVIACDLVAGRGVHPREITKDQREQAQIESGLRIAGDILARHFGYRA